MTIADDAPRPDRVGVGEVILEIGFEGGSFTIVGIKAADGWRFRLARRGLESRHQSDWVESWEGALALLDRYPWHMLAPMQVHRDFRGQVWAAVEDRWRSRGGNFGRPDL
jgi:hypothetical protein